MKKTVQKIPFLRLTIAFAAGIIAGSAFHIPTLAAAALAVISLVSVYFLNRFYKFKYAVFFGATVSLFFIFLGVTLFNIYNQKPHFYQSGSFLASVIEAPVEKDNSYQALLNIQSVQKNDSVFSSNENVLTYFEKTSAAADLKPGDLVIFNRYPQLVENNGNPYEFDYKKYLERKKIYRQLYLPSQNWSLTNVQHPFSLKILAEKTRLKLLNIYRDQNLGENQLNILSALTLGYKRELDPETKRVFSSAGAMHVLAVSGLHVGIIFIILNILFGFLRQRKTGKIIFVLVVIAVLWMFAFLTGLSPSVSRAATMFTFLVVGSNLRRQNNIYNSLAGSALFLLLINPNNLFEVGFQLSYSAVFGIVFLQPRLGKLIAVENKMTRFFWQLLTVSVAAQIATFPFSIYYFNQFPTYFWISNLFVIPAVIFLIPLGFLLLLLHGVPVLGTILSILVNGAIGWLYWLLQTIDSLPFSIREVVVSPPELALLFGILVAVFLLIESRKKIYFKTALVLLLLLSTTSLILKSNRLNQQQLIVYNDAKNTVVHLISGKSNYVVTKRPLQKDDYSMRTIENTVKKLQLNNPEFITTSGTFRDQTIALQNEMLVFGNKTILVQPEIIPENFTPDYIINPENKMDTKQHTLIVLNKRNTGKNKVRNNRVFNIQEDGAFIKKW